VISAGFWPGNGGFGEAAFYAYAYPVPEGLAQAPVLPAAASWNAELGEFVLPYAAVRETSDPEQALHQFLASTFEAAAGLMDWPEGLLVAGGPTYGYPPDS
jgi:hypothetical protein